MSFLIIFTEYIKKAATQLDWIAALILDLITPFYFFVGNDGTSPLLK